MSLSRDQVLHVARLARLELNEDEVERFSTELSKVFEWVETINELGDLEDVEPTSHVVAVENALRADEPRPSLPREVVLASAPDAAQSVGYMLIVVKPGMVLTSFRYNVPVSPAMRKSTRAIPAQSTALNALTAIARISCVSGSGRSAGITSRDEPSRYFAS